jgi:hypothetical protein
MFMVAGLHAPPFVLFAWNSSCCQPSESPHVWCPAVRCRAAETEGYDLIGQVIPKTQDEALQLLVDTANALLLRVEAMGLHWSSEAAAHTKQLLRWHLRAVQDLLTQRKERSKAQALYGSGRLQGSLKYTMSHVTESDDLDGVALMGELDLDQAASDAALLMPDLSAAQLAAQPPKQAWLQGLSHWSDSDSSSDGYVMDTPGAQGRVTAGSSSGGGSGSQLPGSEDMDGSWEMLGGLDRGTGSDQALPGDALDLHDSLLMGDVQLDLWEGADSDLYSSNSSSSNTQHAAISGMLPAEAGTRVPGGGGDRVVDINAAAVTLAAGTSDGGSSQLGASLLDLPLDDYATQLVSTSGSGSNAADITQGLSTDLHGAMQSMLDLLQQLVASGQGGEPGDNTAAATLHQMECLWAQVQSQASSPQQKPLFVFRDGPVTLAAKQGGLLLLEDWDAPSQAITERLNSLLEPERTFLVSEDITVGPAGADVTLPDSFQVGTVTLSRNCSHVSSGSACCQHVRCQWMRVSPKTGLRVVVQQAADQHSSSWHLVSLPRGQVRSFLCGCVCMILSPWCRIMVVAPNNQMGCSLYNLQCLHRLWTGCRHPATWHHFLKLAFLHAGDCHRPLSPPAAGPQAEPSHPVPIHNHPLISLLRR